MRRLSQIIIAALVVSFALTAAPAPGLSAAEPANAAVQMTDQGFIPVLVTVDVGGTVTWRNTGTQSHATRSEHQYDNQTYIWNSPSLPTNDTFSLTFGTAGVYSYVDSVSSSGSTIVRGWIIVGGGGQVWGLAPPQQQQPAASSNPSTGQSSNQLTPIGSTNSNNQSSQQQSGIWSQPGFGQAGGGSSNQNSAYGQQYNPYASRPNGTYNPYAPVTPYNPSQGYAPYGSSGLGYQPYGSGTGYGNTYNTNPYSPINTYNNGSYNPYTPYGSYNPVYGNNPYGSYGSVYGNNPYGSYGSVYGNNPYGSYNPIYGGSYNPYASGYGSNGYVPSSGGYYPSYGGGYAPGYTPGYGSGGYYPSYGGGFYPGYGAGGWRPYAPAPGFGGGY